MVPQRAEVCPQATQQTKRPQADSKNGKNESALQTQNKTEPELVVLRDAEL